MTVKWESYTSKLHGNVDERAEAWDKLTIADILEAKDDAERQIAAILGNLYLQTGVAFQSNESRVLRMSGFRDGWNTTENQYIVRLKAEL